MLDHVGYAVADFERSRRFFDAALAPLGIEPLFNVTAEQTGGDEHTGYGDGGRAYFWIGTGGPLGGRTHVCFTAPSRAVVDAFYAAAMAAGGRDNGPPGVRAHYHPNYYGAFVLDPDGHNIEAVCHIAA